MQEAFAVALERWPRDGWPSNPRAWIVTTARHKAIDVLRRAGRFATIQAELRHTLESSYEPERAGRRTPPSPTNGCA